MVDRDHSPFPPVTRSPDHTMAFLNTEGSKKPAAEIIPKIMQALWFNLSDWRGTGAVLPSGFASTTGIILIVSIILIVIVSLWCFRAAGTAKHLTWFLSVLQLQLHSVWQELLIFIGFTATTAFCIHSKRLYLIRGPITWDIALVYSINITVG